MQNTQKQAMAATTKKTVSIYDYPEHLNPFREEDNHNKIRFWTIGRKLNRSNSINFSGINELKNSWAFRSFIKNGKREQPQQESKPSQDSKESSPIVFRRALQYSSFSTGNACNTDGSPEHADRYVYGGSVTPLPRSRFQERLRSPSQHEVNSVSCTPRMARNVVTGSRLSIESNNPFDEEPEVPVPPVRAVRRKKKMAPPPPPRANKVQVETANIKSQMQIVEEVIQNIRKNKELEEPEFNIELKIVEDGDAKKIKRYDEQERNNIDKNDLPESHGASEKTEKAVYLYDKEYNDPREEKYQKNINCFDDTSFPKVDIIKYRRNSSLNEDDIKLRRGNLEDYTTAITAKRSKSLSNTYDSSYVSYDVDLNDNISETDGNGNGEPQKVICKTYNKPSRKQSTDESVSSTAKEFIEIYKATRGLEQEINKLNFALKNEHSTKQDRIDMKFKFDRKDSKSPNPIPKPRRSHYEDETLLTTPVDVNLHMV